MPDTIAIKDLLDFRDIPYVSDPDGVYQLFDIYIPKDAPVASAPLPLLSFVHGGAWRSEDKSKHELLARRLASLTSWPVAVPNYRLTTPESKLQHPAHTEDLLAFLNFIASWQGPAEAPGRYDPTRIYVIGHSCSAHMLTSIFLERTAVHAPAPTLTPSPGLMSSMRGIIMSEGIYDIDMLLQSFPGYKEWFIANAFGDRASYAPWSTMDMDLGDGMKHAKWLIIHSKGDTLVDMVQSEGIVSSLESNGGDVEYDTQLLGDHNDVLAEEEYPKIVGDFVLRCEGVGKE